MGSLVKPRNTVSQNVPKLNLPKDPENETKLSKSADCWDICLDTPGSSSTVSWGVSAQRSGMAKDITSKRNLMSNQCLPNASANITKLVCSYSQKWLFGKLVIYFCFRATVDPLSKRAWVQPIHSPTQDFFMERNDLYWKRKSELFESILG